MSEAPRTPPAAEARELIERIVASSGFQRSPRLRELLKFIAESSLQTPAGPLTEQQIGISIFHRPPQYDSSADTIVRVQISQLRKRLEHYFLTEGQNERVFVEIPRGSYNAIFQVRDRPSPDGLTASAAEPAVSGARSLPGLATRSKSRMVLTLSAVIAVIALVCVLLALRVWQAESGTASMPAVRKLWSNVVRPSQ